MSRILAPQSKLKRRVVLAVLILMFVTTTIATIFHRLEPNTYPLHLINPPLFAITSFKANTSSTLKRTKNLYQSSLDDFCY